MSDDDQGSVTCLIADLKAGQSAAVQPLWERYFSRMVELARLGCGRPAQGRRQRRGRCGPERLRQPLRGAGPGPFPPARRPRRPLAVAGRHHDPQGQAQARRQLRQKRGGGQVRPASELAGCDSDDEDDMLARAVGSEPTPEFAAMVAEEYRRLLDRLGDDVLRKVAILRMEGYTTEEIAGQLGCARRTVARQLALIRRILATDGP